MDGFNESKVMLPRSTPILDHVPMLRYAHENMISSPKSMVKALNTRHAWSFIKRRKLEITS